MPVISSDEGTNRNMKAKKTPLSYRLLKWLVRMATPKMQVEGLEHLPEGECVIVSNHAHLYGPIAAEIYLGSDRYTWCAAQMMSLKEVPAYTFHEFWSMKPRYRHCFYRAFSCLIAPLAVFITKHANTIPVYYDTRVITTFRQTLRLLREGMKIVIFPEHTVPYSNIVYDFQQHFADVAQMYYALTQQELCFVPMYISPVLKKMVLGKPVRYHHDQPMDEERQRICRELMDAITRIGRELPPHTVVPYAVIPRRDYPANRTDE